MLLILLFIVFLILIFGKILKLFLESVVLYVVVVGIEFCDNCVLLIVFCMLFIFIKGFFFIICIYLFKKRYNIFVVENLIKLLKEVNYW